MTVPATISLDRDAAFNWLEKGAQPTDTAAAILRFKGVMYRKHLQRGINKGALTAEQASERYNEFVENKEKALSARVLQTQTKKAEFHQAVFGTPKPKKVVEAPAAEPTDSGEAAE